MRRHFVSGFQRAFLSLSHAQKRRALGSRLYVALNKNGVVESKQEIMVPNKLKSHKSAHTVRGWPTLKDVESFRNRLVRELYERTFMSEYNENHWHHFNLNIKINNNMADISTVLLFPYFFYFLFLFDDPGHQESTRPTTHLPTTHPPTRFSFTLSILISVNLAQKSGPSGFGHSWYVGSQQSSFLQFLYERTMQC